MLSSPLNYIIPYNVHYVPLNLSPQCCILLFFFIIAASFSLVADPMLFVCKVVLQIWPTFMFQLHYTQSGILFIEQHQNVAQRKKNIIHNTSLCYFKRLSEAHQRELRLRTTGIENQDYKLYSYAAISCCF